MTLILAANSPDSIWMLADRRLSCGKRVVSDDACKIMFLETTDGVAILGYAGLGATAAGTQPSDWMSAVLRGRNMPLEHCLSAIVEAMKVHLPRQLMRMPKESSASHHVVVTAFVDGKPRMYTIDLLLSSDRKRVGFRFLRHELQNPPRPPRFIVAGSGERHLLPNYQPWYRLPLRAIRAVDHKKAGPVAVGRVLAQINFETSEAIPSVGPNCSVAWRHRTGGGGSPATGERLWAGMPRFLQYPRGGTGKRLE